MGTAIWIVEYSCLDSEVRCEAGCHLQCGARGDPECEARCEPGCEVHPRVEHDLNMLLD